ncbi:MAG: GcvT family protein [Nocardioides sp.]
MVVGAGILGSSLAYHLAQLGERDVLMLESNTIASGSTWHAAGLVASLRSTPVLTRLAAYSIDLYSGLQARTGVDVAFNQCGAVVVARTQARLDELKYVAAVAQQCGVQAEVMGPSRVRELWPLADVEGLVGGLHQPQDGHVNPGYVALAMAKLASDHGVRLLEHLPVTRILTKNDRVTGVATPAGDIECERVVLTAGAWSRDIAAACGATVPLYAAEHIHVRTGLMPGASVDLPVMRDMDGYFYARHEQGRLLIGAFEPNGKPRSMRDVQATGFVEFPPDWQHFRAVRECAEERIPVLREVGYERFLNAPESFTPDGNFCLGETAEVSGLYVAAGFNSQGIIFAGGAGRALAEWVVEGSPTFDSSSVDVRRFSPLARNRRFLHERTKEQLGRLYAMHWPLLQPKTARNVRRTPLHQRLAEAGACFGETAGWERANWFATQGQPAVYHYTFGRGNWFERVGEEHRAARQGVAIFDLSSFTKVVVDGPGALRVLQELCTADVDRPIGKIQYTLMLNGRGGVELDGTVIRQDVNRFMIVTPAASHSKTLSMLRRLAGSRGVAVFDATPGLGTLAVMGPRSRELMERISPDEWTDDSQPYGWAREVEVASTIATSLRVSFVGELGYELYPTSDTALNLLDALLEAGHDLGVRLAGYHALDSLRCEKGYRHLGHDLLPDVNPLDAGLGAFVSMKKEPAFQGRDAVLRAIEAGTSRRAVFIALRDPEPLIWGDEPICLDGNIVGQVTSGNYGYTLGRACGIGWIGSELPKGGIVQLNCAGSIVDADISTTPFYDPHHERMRG